MISSFQIFLCLFLNMGLSYFFFQNFKVSKEGIHCEFFLWILEAALVQTHQHDCPNLTWTMATIVGLAWAGKRLQGRAHNWSSNRKWLAQKAYTFSCIQTEHVVFMALGIYMGVAKMNNKKLMLIAWTFIYVNEWFLFTFYMTSVG